MWKFKGVIAAIGRFFCIFWVYLIFVSVLAKLFSGTSSAVFHFVTAAEILFVVLAVIWFDRRLFKKMTLLVVAGFFVWHGTAFFLGKTSECNCFGNIAVVPWQIAVFEAISMPFLASACLFASEPRRPFSRWRWAAGLTAMTAIFVPAYAFVWDSQHGTSPLEGRVDLVSARAATLDTVLPSSDRKLRTGEWLVVFHSRDCGHCEQLITHLVANVTNFDARIALVEVNGTPTELPLSQEAEERVFVVPVDSPIYLAGNLPQTCFLTDGKVADELPEQYQTQVDQPLASALDW